ncbi:hypothetical protein [Pseudoduganella armeniaca]|uniref:NHL repeat-containing protein n=1 Tax=Pseudoduganella armeniaca TaxID=2072590 RepID=A0A2R4C8N7_9BURK|nr:hypothetical protein [Pseudoduganella armeniaca]AVR95966.1 hypothetical protein C9I28_09645 [Pseudoduganella armeniaca]
MQNSRANPGIRRFAALFTLMTVALLPACGGGSGDGTVAPPVATQPPPVTAAPQLTLYAGNTGGAGWVDGRAADARFDGAYDVKLGKDGSFYIADTENHVIRRMTAGVVTTLAGQAGIWGDADGTKTAASFTRPQGIAVDGAQNVYVADTGNRRIRKIDANGNVTTLAGRFELAEPVDGPGSVARFINPVGVNVDDAGIVYVVDRESSRTPGRLRKITPDGVVTTVVAQDSTFAVLGDAVAIDLAGNLYVIGAVGSDTTTLPSPGGSVLPNIVRTAKLLRLSPAGAVTTLGTVSSDASYGGIAVDRLGNVYFSKTSNHEVYAYTASTGQIGLLAGSYRPTGGFDSHGLPFAPQSLGSADGTGVAAQFNRPAGLTTDAAGNLYIADVFNNTLRKASPAGVVTTLAGAAAKRGDANGPALQATFGRNISGSATDGAGNVYVSDRDVIRKIGIDGQVSTFAGGSAGTVDSTGAAVRFTSLAGITIDPAGNVYFIDHVLVRKIGLDGKVTTIAGAAGMQGHVDGAGANARFEALQGITRDGAGNLFVTDGTVVRKITPAGQVSTIAGSAVETGSADGSGSAARFGSLYGITADAAGNVYVADQVYSTLRKISPAGQVTTIAGQAEQEGLVDGAGANARFTNPTGIVIDPSGNLYVSDSGNRAIRKMAPDGTVSTVIMVPSLKQFLFEPILQSLTLGSADTLYLTQSGAVLKLTLGGK